MGNSLKVLHVGSGNETTVPNCFNGWEKVRLDIDPEVKPDILANTKDLGDIGKFDGLYNCHILEHVYPHEVNIVLKEWKRVLHDGALCITFVPDLEGVSADDKVIYTSGDGLPVSGIDMIYGHRMFSKDLPHMAHHTGFVKETLEKAFKDAGWGAVKVFRDHIFNLIAITFPEKLTPEKAKEYEEIFAKEKTFMEESCRLES